MSYRLRLTFLGTSSTFPTSKRNHPAFFIEFKNHGLLLDCGEGTQRQFRKAGISTTKVNKILITHWHGDHVLGIPGLIQSLINQQYNNILEVYGPKGISTPFTLSLESFYTNPKFPIKIIELEHSNEPKKFYEDYDMELYYVSGNHTIETLLYSFKEKDIIKFDKGFVKKIPVRERKKLGKLLKEGVVEIQGKKIYLEDVSYRKKGIKITYITDTLLTNGIFELAKDSDILIIEGMYSMEESEIAKEHYHLSTKEINKIIEKTESRMVFITHISQRYEKEELKILEEIEHPLKFLAEDLMSLTYVKNKILLKFSDGQEKIFIRDEKTGEIMEEP